MPSQFRELWNGWANDVNHMLTQVGPSFFPKNRFNNSPNIFRIQRLGWIWTQQGEGMIPLYAAYNSTTSNTVFTVSNDLATPPTFPSETHNDYDTTYSWIDWQGTKQSDQVHPQPIGFIYRQKPYDPTGVQFVQLWEGWDGSNSGKGSLCSTNLAWNDAWNKVTSLGWILSDAASIIKIVFAPKTAKLQLHQPTLVNAANGTKVIGKQMGLTANFEVWNTFRISLSLDEPLTVPPGILFSNELPFAIGALDQVNPDYPYQNPIVHLEVGTTGVPVMFNVGEINELGGNSECQSDFDIDEGETRDLMMAVFEGSLTMEFTATIGNHEGPTHSVKGTYSCRNFVGLLPFSKLVEKVIPGTEDPIYDQSAPKRMIVQAPRDAVANPTVSHQYYECKKMNLDDDEGGKPKVTLAPVFATTTNLDPSKFFGHEADDVQPTIYRDSASFRLLKPANGATVKTITNILFDWEDVSGASSYQFQVSKKPDFANDCIVVDSPADDSSFTISKLQMNHAPYYWRVRSVDSKGTVGPWSGISYFILQPT